ncbi:MAG: hypothetical protein ACE3L7_14605 [Candidatus Pristimantibacillus sp.]
MRKIVSKAIVIVSLLSTFSFIGSSSSIFANSGSNSEPLNNRYVIESVNGKEVINDTKERVYISSPVSADGTPVPLQEYLEILEYSEIMEKQVQESQTVTEKFTESDQSLVAPMAIYTLSRYEEDLSWKTTGSKVQVSASVDCPPYADEGCPLTSEIQHTYTESFSANVEGGWKDYIRGAFGFSWGKSITNIATYQLPVEKGRTGYMAFRPWIQYTRGVVITDWYNNGTKFGTDTSAMVYSNAAVKLANGYADGIFSIENLY